ncbi:MAG: hypothetical protein NZM18_10260 [Thermoflexales bacterium]|nr:hypothetical protein [Thermoflexales bacterium]
MKALREPDKHRIACANSRQLRGSVCIDDALKAALPNEPRWDYAVGYSDTAGAEQIIWVEVHPAAKSDHLKEVRGKLEWLMEWLRTKAQPMNYTPRRIVWIATGLSNFSQGDPHIRALKDRGLEFVGRRLEL